ncbi:MAG: DUF664 domain-containing protein [Chloroflexi bacterium]|nr:DUF664 domain-containing protein [Chloroflexota bacterium]
MEPIFAEAISRLEWLHAEYARYMDGLTTEELDWSPGPDMSSCCVLAVHVTAAERFWFGAVVDDMITRDRPAEFRASGYELSQLTERFEANVAFCKEVFPGQSASRLGEIVDVSRYRHWPPQRFSRGWALLRGLDHTAEHLGHAGMTRQLLDRR